MLNNLAANQLYINGQPGISGTFETLCAAGYPGTITYERGFVTGDTCPT
jgi:hypothetical protein